MVRTYKTKAMKRVACFAIAFTVVICSCGKENDHENDTDNMHDPKTVGTMTDIDGNSYYTVKIGNQWWMKENFKTTRYNDGSPISDIQSVSEWASTIEGAYCAYNNNESYADTFGLLYNYYAFESGKLSPDGWRMPTKDDWLTLLRFIKDTLGIPNESDALRSYSGWWDEFSAEEQNGLDLVGFKALPAGYREPLSDDSGGFHGNKSWATFWSTTEITDGTHIYVLQLSPYMPTQVSHDGGYGAIYGPTNMGLSIRLIKEE